jgi:hypothetical protein
MQQQHPENSRIQLQSQRSFGDDAAAAMALRALAASARSAISFSVAASSASAIVLHAAAAASALQLQLQLWLQCTPAQLLLCNSFSSISNSGIALQHLRFSGCSIKRQHASQLLQQSAHLRFSVGDQQLLCHSASALGSAPTVATATATASSTQHWQRLQHPHQRRH